MKKVTIDIPKTPAQNKKQDDRLKELEASCPDGYSVINGSTIDMLGKTELWRIFENQDEPQLSRIPQDFVDFGNGRCPARAPKEWGRCLYYKVN